MDEFIFYDTMRQGLWAALLMSTPILTVALVVGLIIGLVQALTSIQEMTLTFVPPSFFFFVATSLSLDMFTPSFLV